MLLLAFLSFLVSWVAVFYVRRWFRRHAEAYGADKPQRFHRGAVPRLGGVGMLLGWLFGLTVAAVLPRLGVYLGVSVDGPTYFGLVAVVLLAVLVGIAEDATQRVSVRWRLLLSAAAGMVA
ncbi:MAG: hypothetical protein RLZZ192_635, partial [Pseudomonadota bacterium]